MHRKIRREERKKQLLEYLMKGLIENKFAVSVFDGMRIDFQVNGFMEKSL